MMRIAFSLLAFLSIAVPAAGQADARLTAPERAELRTRMKRFVAAVVGQRMADSAAAYFPRAGDFTYTRTTHLAHGTRVGVQRFRGVDAPAAIKVGGALRESFEIQPEGQPIGLFLHQVLMRDAFARRKGWRLAGTRFVPAGLFVEWRREGGAWVVSAFGDEGFRGGKLPGWCC